MTYTQFNSHSRCFVSTFLLTPLLLCLAGCEKQPSKKENAKSDSKPTVAIVNFPIKFFVDRIAGEEIEILQAIPQQGENVLNWTPDSGTITAIQQSDLILLNGAGFSKWLQTVSLPQGKTVNTTESFDDKYIRLNSFVHRHGPKGNQSDKKIISATWLDFQLAEQQAAAVLDALTELMPDSESQFRENFENLKTDLKKLDQEFQQTGEKLKGTTILSSNSDYQYLARKYQIDIKPLSWKGATELDDDKIDELKTQLKASPSKWMIWPNDPGKAMRQKLKDDFEIEIIALDSGAIQNESSDWVGIMKKNMTALKSIKPK